jgi:hypothetical protein
MPIIGAVCARHDAWMLLDAVIAMVPNVTRAVWDCFDVQLCKLVHANVFRPLQQQHDVLCLFGYAIGAGTALIAIGVAAIGLLSPARHGSWIHAFLARCTICRGALTMVARSFACTRVFRGPQWQY